MKKATPEQEADPNYFREDRFTISRDEAAHFAKQIEEQRELRVAAAKKRSAALDSLNKTAGELHR
jgi:hypothetical protein